MGRERSRDGVIHMHKIGNSEQDAYSRLKAASARLKSGRLQPSLAGRVRKEGRRPIGEGRECLVGRQSVALASSSIGPEPIGNSLGGFGECCSPFDSDERDDWIYADFWLEELLEQR
jgi:hypothetical protein